MRTQVKVCKYKGDRAAQRGIEAMMKKGWQLENQDARKAVFSLAAGLFTRKQIHTITFKKEVATRQERKEAKEAATV